MESKTDCKEDYVPTIHSKFAIENSKKALVLHKIK